VLGRFLTAVTLVQVWHVHHAGVYVLHEMIASAKWQRCNASHLNGAYEATLTLRARNNNDRAEASSGNLKPCALRCMCHGNAYLTNFGSIYYDYL
jgi:hypothetical protein